MREWIWLVKQKQIQKINQFSNKGENNANLSITLIWKIIYLTNKKNHHKKIIKNNKN